jgi:hypothetical protein
MVMRRDGQTELLSTLLFRLFVLSLDVFRDMKAAFLNTTKRQLSKS